MNQWWRAYVEALDDPKLQRLSDFLFRCWFNIMCVACRHNGSLPSIPDLAFRLRLNEEKTKKVVHDLKQAGLLDDDGQDKITPHNWSGRQYKSDVTDPTNANRQRRYREQHKKRDRNDSVTDGVTDKITGTVTVNKTDAKRPDSDSETDSSEPKGSAVPEDQEVELFRRGKQILGVNAGGLIAKIKAHHGGNVAKARATIETASTKQDPREWVGRVLRGRQDDGFAATTGAIV
jgi:hypothetical protein